MSVGRAPDSSRAPMLATLAVGMILLIAGLAMVGTHRSGHYWGDDFALYLRQAESISGPLVGFFKARAMTLEAGRLAVQVGQDRSPFDLETPLDLLVLERTSPGRARCSTAPGIGSYGRMAPS